MKPLSSGPLQWGSIPERCHGGRLGGGVPLDVPTGFEGRHPLSEKECERDNSSSFLIMPLRVMVVMVAAMVNVLLLGSVWFIQGVFECAIVVFLQNVLSIFW